jgi:hypothetical protein
MQSHGYAVTAFDVPSLSEPRRRVDMPSRYRSCHVARVGGYAIEGHVPAEDIGRLLAERPDANGLAVPGMPYGAPGIGEGTRRVDFEVLLVLRNGRARTWARYAARA